MPIFTGTGVYACVMMSTILMITRHLVEGEFAASVVIGHIPPNDGSSFADVKWRIVVPTMFVSEFA